MTRSVQDSRSQPNGGWRMLLSALAMVVLGFLGGAAGSAWAGDLSVTASISGGVAGGPSTYGLTGTGNSSQLGDNFDYTGTVQITGGVGGGLALSDTLTETLHFGNGDTLTLLCLQSAAQISASPAVYHGQDRWTVIGGTGTFKGATGSGTGDTYVDLTASTFIKVLSGIVTKAK